MHQATRRTTLVVTLGAALPATLWPWPVAQASAPQDPAKEKKELLRRANDQWQAEYEKLLAANKAAERRGEFSSLAPPKALIPFKDWDYYYSQGISVWKPNLGQTFKPVAVPDRFVTDLTSIPQPVWGFGIRPEGAYAYAAVVHDYLYWMQDRTREESDEIFLIAMADSKVEEALRNRIYNAVRLGGNVAWNKNAELKRKGEKRVLRQVPKDFTISWSDWKSRPGVFQD